MSNKKIFKLPVEWAVFGTIEIEAESLEDALKIFCKTENEIELPTERDYIEDSFKLSTDASPYINIEATAKEIRDYYEYE